MTRNIKCTHLLIKNTKIVFLKEVNVKTLREYILIFFNHCTYKKQKP